MQRLEAMAKASSKKSAAKSSPKSVSKSKPAAKAKPVSAKPAGKAAVKTASKTSAPAAKKTTQAGKWVYTFGDGRAEGKAGMRDLLGGKGANLAEMANLGLPVPPGFTIPTSVCTYF